MSHLISSWAVGIVFLAGMVHAQEWERLPLDGGHLDRLIVNPYNDHEIYGFIQGKDLYRSVDGGLHWKRIISDTIPFHPYYLDLTVDLRGRVYTITSDGVWRSSDHGENWNHLSVPGGTEFNGNSQIEVNEMGIILVWNGSIKTLFRSLDDGGSWIGYSVRDRALIDEFYQAKKDSTFLVAQTRDSFLVSKDGARNWEELQSPVQSYSEFTIDPDSPNLVIRYSSGSGYLDFYESRDTCITWRRMNEEEIVVDDEAHSGSARINFIQMNDSIFILNRFRILLRSIDSGRTWARISAPEYLDVVRSGTDLIGTVSMKGIFRSTDFGDTWDLVPGQPEILNFAEVEFVHAHDDTMFVLLSDGWRPVDRSSWFLESVDGGMSWRKLFDSRVVYDLSVDAGRPARYYLLAASSLDRWSIITGITGQSKPDTIHTFDPHWHPWDRFPGYVYASKNNATIGVSSDRGTTWEWSSVGLGLTDVRPWASQNDAYRVVVSGSTKDWNYTEREGIYFTATGGSPFEFMNANSDLAVYAANMYVNPDDRYFLLGVPDSGSFDYGRTWQTIRDGLDPGTTIRQIYQSHCDVLLWTDTGLYCFRDDRWQHLRTPEGAPLLVEGPWELERSTPVNVQTGDDYIYALAPGYGMYRTRLGPLTGVENSPDIRGTGLNLELFPNPSAGDVTIRWHGQAGSLITITIRDLLGREVWRWTGDGSVGSQKWSRRRLDTFFLPAGVYFIQLLSGHGFDVATMILR